MAYTREQQHQGHGFFCFLFIAHPEPRGAFDTHVHTALAWSYSHCIFDKIGFSLRGKAYVPFGIWKHETRWLSPTSNLVLFRRLPVRLSISRWRARRRETGEILHVVVHLRGLREGETTRSRCVEERTSRGLDVLGLRIHETDVGARAGQTRMPCCCYCESEEGVELTRTNSIISRLIIEGAFAHENLFVPRL